MPEKVTLESLMEEVHKLQEANLHALLALRKLLFPGSPQNRTLETFGAQMRENHPESDEELAAYLNRSLQVHERIVFRRLEQERARQAKERAEREAAEAAAQPEAASA